MDMNLVLQEMKMKRRGSDNLKEGVLKKHIGSDVSKGEEVTKGTSKEDTSEEQVFVESSMHRKGSKVYKNKGWKYSRNNSASSFRSLGRHSSSEESADSKNPHKKSLEDKPPPQCMPKLSKKDMDDFLEKKFDEIFLILKCAGVDINM